ncbi:MAG: BsuPI-related putative proteinase inhibitor [Bryobacteraceae bacterium]
MRLLTIAALCAASSFAQDYFPLHVGNQWVYTQTGTFATAPVVVQVAESQVIDGRSFSLVRGLPEGPLWLHQSADGLLISIDPATKTESVWARFAAAEGGTYETSVTPCNSTASVRSRNATAELPVGTYGGALEIAYPNPTCADAGLESETFLPWIGLVKRTSTSIAGPVSLALSYARVGGVTVLSQPENAFALTIDKTSYAPAANINARLNIRATQTTPLTLSFSSGQRFDFAIRNDAGETVYTWSADKLFPAVLGTEAINGERNWAVSFPAPQAPGNYTVEGWLTSARPYKATVSFTVAER